LWPRFQAAVPPSDPRELNQMLVLLSPLQTGSYERERSQVFPRHRTARSAVQHKKLIPQPGESTPIPHVVRPSTPGRPQFRSPSPEMPSVQRRPRPPLHTRTTGMRGSSWIDCRKSKFLSVSVFRVTRTPFVQNPSARSSQEPGEPVLNDCDSQQNRMSPTPASSSSVVSWVCSGFGFLSDGV